MKEPDREETIFASLLGLPPGERAAYLDGACGADAALRLRLEELLAAHEGAGMEAPAASPPTKSATRAAFVSEKPGDRIGHYKLLEQIGEGGCGIVYVAEQEEPLRRRVALKLVKLGMDTKQVVARFETERQALALMDHPNIAKVLDAGATETGRPFFVMELVRGIKITDYCDRNKLTTQERLNLFVQVCRALQHAHQKGIIHRDIKPSNVLVTVNDGVAVPKVIDFGIAKATQGRLTDETVYTAFEQFIGTPAYMSPEQAAMTSLDIDTRSDIYSLGVLLYELLTGQTPFETKELLEAGIDAIRRTIQENEPPKPSTRLSTMLAADLTSVALNRRAEPPKLIHAVRGDLDWIVMKALEKDRTRRYESANNFATDIERHLNDEAVSARPPSRAYEFRKIVRRHKFGFVAGLAILVALAVGIGLSTWEYFNERDARRRAEAAEQEQTRLRREAEVSERRALTEAAKSKQVSRFLEDAIYGASPYNDAPLGADRTGLLEIADRTAARIGEELKGQPEVEAELRDTLAATYAGFGQWDKAEAMAREALRLRREVFGETNHVVVFSLDRLAFVLVNNSKLEEAEAFARQALSVTQVLSPKDNPELANALATLGDVLSASIDKLSEAERSNREALEMYRRLQGNESTEQGWVLQQLAWVLYRGARYVEAETFGREAVTMNRKFHGENYWTLLSVDILAKVLVAQGKQTEAESLHREVWEISKKNFGAGDMRTAGSLQHLAETLLGEGKNAEAKKLLPDLLQVQKVDIYNAGLGWVLLREAELLLQEGKNSDAEKLLRELLTVQERSENKVRIACTLAYLSAAIHAQGNLTEPCALANEAVALYTNSSVDLKPWVEIGVYERLKSVLEACGNVSALVPVTTQFTKDLRAQPDSFRYVAETLLNEGKNAEVEKMLPDLLEVQRVETNNLRLGWTLAGLADVLLNEGKKAESESLLRELLSVQKATTNKAGVVCTLAYLSTTLHEQGKLTAACVVANEAVGAYTNSSIRFEPWVAACILGKLKVTMETCGDTSSLEPVAIQFVKDLRSWPDAHRFQLVCLSYCASLLAGNDKPQQARPYAEEAVKLCQEHPPKAQDVWIVPVLLGALAETLNRFGETNYLETNALQLVQAVRPSSSDSPRFALLLADTADIFRLHGKTSEARPLAAEAMANLHRTPKEFEPWIQRRIFNAMTALEQEQGNLTELERLYHEEISSGTIRLDEEDLTKAKSNLAELLRKQGKQSEADALLQGQADAGSEKRITPSKTP